VSYQQPAFNVHVAYLQILAENDEVGKAA
jgi:hypothetical protein